MDLPWKGHCIFEEYKIKLNELDVAYQNGNALYYLAQAYRKNNDLESAKPYYAKFLELYPNTERAATAARYAE